MKKQLCLFGITSLLLTVDSLAEAEPQLDHLQQLTHGGANAEAYWSPDGKRLIFQATRDGHDCDQQYIMNADGSDQHLVSTGKGATTCGYFLADGKHILYASTHEGPAHEEHAACPPKPDRSRGYVWPVYPDYDIYLADDSGKVIKKLTDNAVYDAETTINWRTHRIVYTSLVSGELEVWSMNEDGTDKKQLTHAVGYDGGAVFSRDGSQMVWRAYHPDTPEKVELYLSLLKENLTQPMKMELFVARADGSDAKQITHFGCASFAPTFTPDGKKILFASNKHHCDSSDFELYLINTDGTGLEQVTSYGGFTSFPEFSPDGTKLAFASSYRGQSKYEFNVFTADWKEGDGV
jgi:TolB protein